MIFDWVTISSRRHPDFSGLEGKSSDVKQRETETFREVIKKRENVLKMSCLKTHENRRTIFLPGAFACKHLSHGFKDWFW